MFLIEAVTGGPGVFTAEVVAVGSPCVFSLVVLEAVGGRVEVVIGPDGVTVTAGAVVVAGPDGVVEVGAVGVISGDSVFELGVPTGGIVVGAGGVIRGDSVFELGVLLWLAGLVKDGPGVSGLTELVNRVPAVLRLAGLVNCGPVVFGLARLVKGVPGVSGLVGLVKG